MEAAPRRSLLSSVAAQHGGQQRHPHVHALLCLPEVRGARVRVHLHAADVMSVRGVFPPPPPGPGWEPFPPLHSPLFPPFARRTPAACDPLSPGPHTQTPFTPSSHISLHTGTGPFPVPPQPSPDAPLLQGPHQLVAPPSRIPFLLTWTASNPCLPLSPPAKPLSSFLPLLPHSRTP